MSTSATQPRSGAVKRVWLWVAGTALGTAVLALPDTGPRVFSLSGTHGPSVIDLVGISLLVGTWLPTAALIWSSRRDVRNRRGLLALAAVGLLVLVVTITSDLGWTWIVGALILLGAQVIAVRMILRRPAGMGVSNLP